MLPVRNILLLLTGQLLNIDEGGLLTGRHDEDLRPDPPEGVGDRLGPPSGEGFLFVRGNLVGDDTAHLGQFTESVTHCCCSVDYLVGEINVWKTRKVINKIYTTNSTKH